MKAITLIGLCAPLVIAACILGPLGTIWALNTLFALAIPYTLKTWAAVLWLGMSLNVAARSTSAK